jgi:glycosyltransferase involved in cell wall biosynthesis
VAQAVTTDRKVTNRDGKPAAHRLGCGKLVSVTFALLQDVVASGRTRLNCGANQVKSPEPTAAGSVIEWDLLGDEPRVSITIISYNQATYLPQALESALAQDYRNVEIVVSDDASTDGSDEILRRYAARHPDRIVPIYNSKNGGLAENRDRAIRASTGELICWLDADDLFAPTKLSQQVEFMKRHRDCAVSYHNMWLLRDEVKTEDLYLNAARPAREGDHTVLLRYENFVPSPSVMFRVAALPQRSYHLPEGPTYSDYHFLIRLAQRGRLRYLAAPLGWYRRHSSSATASQNGLRSGVRRRRERALWAVYREAPESRSLAKYALARFYLSLLAGARAARSYRSLVLGFCRLIQLLPESFTALKDRKLNKNTLKSFEY